MAKKQTKKSEKLPDMPFCEACKSYHWAPSSEAHWRELKCRDSYAGKKSGFLDRKVSSRLIIPPRAGWLQQAYYYVEVSVADNNPIFNGVLYTGFLTPEGHPGSYAKIMAPGCIIDLCTDRVFFVRAVRLIRKAHETANTFKLPTSEDLTKKQEC